MTDHIVMLENTSTIKCMHCGMGYTINMPCPATLFTAMMDKFIEMHKDCEAEDD